MPKARFFIEITPQERTQEGDEEIEFFFSPNLGEKKVSIQSFASGGELSRLLLAIHSLLAGKTEIPTLIFDEIDANIGGEAAKNVGKKLKAIAKEQQVFCVTHFPQVAQFADQHFCVEKIEKNGRTLTTITYLSSKKRDEELARMFGK